MKCRSLDQSSLTIDIDGTIESDESNVVANTSLAGIESGVTNDLFWGEVLHWLGTPGLTFRVQTVLVSAYVVLTQPHRRPGMRQRMEVKDYDL